MVENKFMASATSLAQLSSKLGPLGVFEEGLFDADVATARGENGALDGPLSLHAAHNVRRSGVQ